MNLLPRQAGNDLRIYHQIICLKCTENRCFIQKRCSACVPAIFRIGYAWDKTPEYVESEVVKAGYFNLDFDCDDFEETQSRIHADSVALCTVLFISWNARNCESDHIRKGASVILHCSANTRYTSISAPLMFDLIGR